MFLYYCARQSLGAPAAGIAAAAAFALNPNLLYLQSTPMTEPVFLACETGLAAAIVWFAASGRMLAVVAAGAAALAGTMTRYEGWFLLPVAAGLLFLAAKKNRWRVAAVFCVIAGAGPLFWLGCNRYYYSNWLEFYNGPYSAKAIQGTTYYPGMNNWQEALRYYGAAARECAGMGVILAMLAGFLGVILKRAWIPVVVFAAVPLFYVWSMHSGGTPVRVPPLWPGGYYNSRYGIALLPLAAFCAAGIVALAPRGKSWFAAAVALASLMPWVIYPRMSNWVVFQEAVVNSSARRAWTADAAQFLRSEYRPGDRVYTSFGDLTGIFREAGIPLSETMHEGNGLTWYAAQTRPDLFFWQKWAVVRRGDRISGELKKRNVEIVRIIRVTGAPTIEIFRNDYPFSQSPRRAK